MAISKREPQYISNSTIPPSVFVKPDPNNDEMVLQADGGDDPCGVSQEGQRLTPGLVGSDSNIAASAGQSINVHHYGEVCFLQVTGSVAAGDWLKPTTGGKGMTTTTAGDIVGARALQAASNNKCLVQVWNKLL